MSSRPGFSGATLYAVDMSPCDGDEDGGRGGGDDGTIPPMDHAARLDQFDSRLTRVESKLEHVDREVSNLKWWLLGSVLTIVLTTIGTVIGTGVGIQQMTVATFQAAGQAAQAPAQPTVIVIPQTPAPPTPR